MPDASEDIYRRLGLKRVQPTTDIYKRLGLKRAQPESQAGGGEDAHDTAWYDLLGRAKQFGRDITSEKAWQEFLKTPQPIGGKRAFETGMGLALGAGPANLRSIGAVPGLVRGMVTPEHAAAAQRMANMQQAGIDPSVPAVGGGYAQRLTTGMARALPWSPIESGSQRQLGQAAASAGAAAQQFGAPQGAHGIGSVIKNAIMRFAEDRTQGGRDFGRFFALMHGAPPIPMTNTIAALRNIVPRYPSAPELEDVLNDPAVKRMLSGIEPKQVTAPAIVSPMLGPGGQPIVTTPARTFTQGGTLTVQELKNVRTALGYRLNHIHYGPDTIPKAELSRIYAALSNDMKAAARARGPAALKALETANFNYGTRMNVIKFLGPLVKQGEASPESTFAKLNAAAQEKGGDLGLLYKAKQVLNPQEWGDVGASIIQQLGKPTKGQADPNRLPFSVNSFTTNWSGLSAKAKDLLFGPPAPGTPRQGLEALASAAASMKHVEKLANISHSGEYVMAQRVIEGAVGMVAAGLSGQFPAEVASAATGVGLSYAAAKLMMMPGFTRWMYELPRVISGARTLQDATRAAATTLQRAVLSNASAVQPPKPRKPPAVGERGPMGGTVTQITQPPPPF